MGFLTNLDNGITAFKGAFTPQSSPNYARLSDATHSYNLESERFGLFSFLGLGAEYYRPKEDLKWYYENIPFFADCINLYADIAAQVKISEIDQDSRIVENSEIVKFLEQPNPWQDQISFIKEMVINVLTTGMSIQYGNFFDKNRLGLSPNLYNIDFKNISIPKVKDRYVMTQKEIQELLFLEDIGGGAKRKLKFSELSLIYDTIAKQNYGKIGADDTKILNPISRIFSIYRSLQIMENTEDSMMYLSGNNVNFIVSKKSANGGMVPLDQDQKADIETKLSGKGVYGTRSGKRDVIATNEDLQALSLQRDVAKMKMIEMQNNAKENIRSAYVIPRDLLDAFNGTNSGSTYENQQFAEARFTLNNVKNITDAFLYQIEKKIPEYFTKKGTRLIGTYDHMPSISAVNQKIKNEGAKSKAEALSAFFKAFDEAKNLGITQNYDDFAKMTGFEGLINANVNE